MTTQADLDADLCGEVSSDAGYAYRQGEPVSANPHREGTRAWRWWHDGWWTADRMRRAALAMNDRVVAGSGFGGGSVPAGRDRVVGGVG